MPTMLLLTPLVRPPAPPVPIRLNELAAFTVPAMSLAIDAAPWKLPPTIVLYNVTGRALSMPAPSRLLEPELTRLAVIVSLTRLAVPEPLSA